jgi:hypothetical protein
MFGTTRDAHTILLRLRESSFGNHWTSWLDPIRLVVWEGLGMSLRIVAAGVLLLATSGSPLFAQTQPAPEMVTFPTNVVPNSSAAMAVQLRAQLFMPGDTRHPVSAVVITPSSDGVKGDIEWRAASATI